MDRLNGWRCDSPMNDVNGQIGDGACRELGVSG